MSLHNGIENHTIEQHTIRNIGVNLLSALTFNQENCAAIVLYGSIVDAFQFDDNE